MSKGNFVRIEVVGEISRRSVRHRSPDHFCLPPEKIGSVLWEIEFADSIGGVHSWSSRNVRGALRIRLIRRQRQPRIHPLGSQVAANLKALAGLIDGDKVRDIQPHRNIHRRLAARRMLAKIHSASSLPCALRCKCRRSHGHRAPEHRQHRTGQTGSSLMSDPRRKWP